MTTPWLRPAVFASFCMFTLLSAEGGEPATLSSLFEREPADALVRQLPADIVDKPASPEAELSVTSRCRRLAEPGMVVIETTVTNRSERPQKLPEVTVADLPFRLRDAQDAGYQRLTHRNDVWYGSTYWSGPDWTRVGKDWHHPGQNTPAVRRFTAPRNGRITITGRVYKAHVSPSDGVRLMVLHAGRTVWQAEIDGTDDKGVEPQVELEVAKGDAVRFLVHKRGEIYCDTTHWDPVITYADGPVFRASEGFSTTGQGENGWSYEMTADANGNPGRPRAYVLDHRLALAEIPLISDQRTTVTDRANMPCILLAGGSGEDGLVAALCSAGPWQCRIGMTGSERLDLQWIAVAEETLAPGRSLQLPRLVLASYHGQLAAALDRLRRVIDCSARDGSAELVDQFHGALAQTAGLEEGQRPGLDLWLMLQAEWRQEDKLEETAASYTGAAAVHLGKARELLADLQADHGGPRLARCSAELGELARKAGTGELPLDACRRVYQSVRWLKRRIALSNPRMDFDRLLFCKRVPTSYSHLVMQYYGWRARPGGGLFVLERPGWSLECRDILGGRLADGNVLEPRLSYDARRIVFSFVRCSGKPLEPQRVTNDLDDGFYHVQSVNVDGSGLTQLTGGRFDDLMPTWLPDGGIAFCSTRRRGYARCFGAQFSPRWDVYTLHRMQADGSGLRTLSFHDTNEWFPAVSNTGHILYARWDYIDRDAVTHQNLWASRPDGTNPVALWGNATSSPHCTFQIQPIPGSTKIVFTASAHHSITAGSIALVDPSVNNNGQAAIERITPEIPFPEAESRDIREYYAAPWPLSEKYFLVAYSPKPLVWEPGANDADALGIYLLDKFGNRELIYRDPTIGSTNPCPLVPRPVPPVLPSMLPDDAPPVGEMILADVYQGLGDCEPGSIKELRIVQIFPKTTPVANSPPIGLAKEENARAILGTVPVEPDGSARFLVPARKPILFQALDADGFAYQTMRTITYLQPGERVTCVGCHENRMSAPVPKDILALDRPPSEIDPGELGGRPFSYASVVQPVLDRHCVSCHGGEKTEGDVDLTGAPHQGLSRSYWALCSDRDFWAGGTNPQNAAEALVPRFGGRNQIQVTPPGGLYGARGSRLMKLLRAGHYDVRLSPQELRHVAAWIDLNAVFYGAYSPEDQARQLRGEELAMPEVQ